MGGTFNSVGGGGACPTSRRSDQNRKSDGPQAREFFLPVNRAALPSFGLETSAFLGLEPADCRRRGFLASVAEPIPYNKSLYITHTHTHTPSGFHFSGQP